ncbi:MAG TPA: hypothetical protein VKD91_14335 [Pyrinomonadaceae bacterium]|nr:hypothetical protein [Pyrinomonadaceae bacterium]
MIDSVVGHFQPRVDVCQFCGLSRVRIYCNLVGSDAFVFRATELPQADSQMERPATDAGCERGLKKLPAPLSPLGGCAR